MSVRPWQDDRYLNGTEPPDYVTEPDNREPEAGAIDWAALDGLEPPPRRWAEQGWLGFNHATLLAGDGGIGKTLLAQQIASLFATGRRLLHGRDEPLRTLMWACEDDYDELWRRQMDICRWQDSRLGDYTNFHLVPRVGLDNALMYISDGRPALTPLLGKLINQADAMQADVVFLDNIAQLYGADENNRNQTTYFVNALVGALRGRAVTLLGHPAKAQGSEFSGSTAWEAAVRSRLYFGHRLPGDRADDTQDDTRRVLARRKANYAARDHRGFTWHNGVFVPDSEPTVLDAKLELEATAESILTAFRQAAAGSPEVIISASRAGSASAFGSLRAFAAFPDKLKAQNGRNSRKCYEIIDKLIAEGLIIQSQYRKSDRHLASCLRLK